MPNSGSVNHSAPSLAQTMSLGEFNRLPLKVSASTVTLPSYSVRVTRRVRCSQASSRPWRSRARPLAKFDGARNTLVALVHSSQRRMRLFGMSDKSRNRPSPNHTGPSAQRSPVASCSTLAEYRRSARKLSCNTSTAGSG